MAKHAAFWIIKGFQGSWKPWVTLIESVPAFGLDLAKHLTKISYHDYTGSREHPDRDVHFDKDNLFPKPPQPVRQEAELETEVVGAEKEKEDKESGDNQDTRSTTKSDVGVLVSTSVTPAKLTKSVKLYR